MTDYTQKIEAAESLSKMLKQAFQPMPPAAPPGMDPAMMAQQQGGGQPPTDPAMAAQGGMPTGAPPAGDPSQQIEGVLSELMGAVEQLAGAMEQNKQIVAQLQAQAEQTNKEHIELMTRFQMIEKAINQPSPVEGHPGQML